MVVALPVEILRVDGGDAAADVAGLGIPADVVAATLKAVDMVRVSFGVRFAPSIVASAANRMTRKVMAPPGGR